MKKFNNFILWLQLGTHNNNSGTRRARPPFSWIGFLSVLALCNCLSIGYWLNIITFEDLNTTTTTKFQCWKLELNQSGTDCEVMLLFQAVQHEELSVVKEILEDVSERMNIVEIWDEQLKSLLHVAVERDDELADYLIEEQGFWEKLVFDKIFQADLLNKFVLVSDELTITKDEYKRRVFLRSESIQYNGPLSSVLKKRDWEKSVELEFSHSILM
ncbi:unnamed protein product [Orchesella dallaii]|uniref:Uncharacterized protein n=1 Tax=Orchesella dallaii TaxID=48710 RepID=A0ABP1RF80_9HEXA